MAPSLSAADVQVAVPAEVSRLWLALGGLVYIALGLTGVLRPEYQAKVFAISQPALFSEVDVMLWLVITGAKPQGVGDLRACAI